MPVEFSVRTRQQQLDSLAGGAPFDLLIIGGGITGAGAARDAALRGYRVALVEQHDFASGTSSKSTKLIHGGLRYLEHFEFGLVFEALQERKVLLEQAPHLVQPQPLIFPIYEGDKNGFLKMAAGMWLYDGLSLFRNVARHQMLRREAVQKEIPGLNADRLTGAAHYFDARTHDARLTLVNAAAAHGAGALLLTYCGVEAITTAAGDALQQVRVRDGLSGEAYEIQARLLLNCTGPWTDRIIQMADPTVPPRLRPSKGVHLVLARDRLDLDEAVYIAAPQDGRPVFIIPWERALVVGTTDTFYDGSLDDVPVTDEDVHYLLDVVNYAFPQADVQPADVRSSWAGLRPLITDPGAKSEGATSREHDIWEGPDGLVSIAGGKLTTYRVMARQLIDVAAEKLAARHGLPARPAVDTGAIPLPGAEGPMPGENPTDLDDDIWEHLVSYYGIHAGAVSRRAQLNPALRERLVPTLPYIWAELDHAIEYELCLTADDYLARRSWLIYEAPQRGAEVLDEVVERMGARVGWDEARRAREQERYLHTLSLLAGNGGPAPVDGQGPEARASGR